MGAILHNYIMRSSNDLIGCYLQQSEQDAIIDATQDFQESINILEGKTDEHLV